MITKSRFFATLSPSKNSALRINFQFKNNFYGNSQGSTSFLTQLVSQFPPTVQNYLNLLRIDKPIGSYLLFWPGAWSIALASPTYIPDLKILSLFAIGSVIMRGAGCIVNDLWDRNLDKKVARTANRPIASGAISTKQAVVFLGSQLLLGLGVLLQLNNFSIILGMCSLPLVFIYPFMKRVTYWPQFVLGLTFNWGALLGYSSVLGYLDYSIVLPLYASGVFWTLFYDTIYAHQDRIDDLNVGIKSSALALGNNTHSVLTLFSGATLLLLLFSGTNLGIGFNIGLLFAASHLYWQLSNLNINNPENCAKLFRSNAWFGLIVFLAILLGKATLNSNIE